MAFVVYSELTDHLCRYTHSVTSFRQPGRTHGGLHPSGRGAFEAVFRAEGLEVMRTPVRAPNAKRCHGAPDREHTTRVPGWVADPQPPASGAGHEGVGRALQPSQAAPSPWPGDTGCGPRPWKCHRRDSSQRAARRLVARVLARRRTSGSLIGSMTSMTSARQPRWICVPHKRATALCGESSRRFLSCGSGMGPVFAILGSHGERLGAQLQP